MLTSGGKMDDFQFPRYEEILLPDDSPFQGCISGSSALGPLSLVNIFIGANSSGKSRLLRHLFTLEGFSYTTNYISADPFYSFAEDIKKEFDAILPNGITAVGNIRETHLNDIISQNRHFISPAQPIQKMLKEKLDELASATGGSASGANVYSVDDKAIAERFRNLGTQALERFQTECPMPWDVRLDKRYYIPILRGMRPLDAEHSNGYRDRTMQDYFKDAPLEPGREIFTGIELYQTLKSKLLGEPEEREAVRDFEGFLSTKFFRSLPVTLIPREGDSTVHIKIGDERQFPICQVGDGLQSLIICVFNIYMELVQNTRALFFIEEPDMCMHPSMQRTFLEVLNEYKQHQYFITTHSNHFLDMTLDYSGISVFHFRKVEDAELHFEINVASSRDHNVLLDLGVRNSSVFLTNATIWVEGITDRLYLRCYMEKYRKELKEGDSAKAGVLNKLTEDYHYSFVEYQGSTLTHWDFDPESAEGKRIKASYLCGNAFVIADGDIINKGNRRETYESMLGDRFCLLPVKEIENLIPEDILRKVVAGRFEERQKDVSGIQFGDYAKQDVGLGRHLDQLLSLNDGESFFSTDSGTIKAKVTFCEKAIEIMNSPDTTWQLPEPMTRLCEKIFSHILSANGPSDAGNTT